MRSPAVELHAALMRRVEETTMTQTLLERPTEPPANTTLVTPRFVAVAVAALAYFTGDGILIAAVPRFVAGPLGAGNIAVGIVVGAFSVSAFFLRPWVGGLGDRRGRKPLMLIGTALFTVSILGYGLSSDPATLAGLRLLTGAGEAFFFVGMVTAFTDMAPPQRRGEAMSLASLSLYVGIGAGRCSASSRSSGSASRRHGCSPPVPGSSPSPWCSRSRRPVPARPLTTPERRHVTVSCTRRASCRASCSSRASSGWPASWPSCPCTRSTWGWAVRDWSCWCSPASSSRSAASAHASPTCSAQGARRGTR
jgi:hypothetical protein